MHFAGVDPAPAARTSDDCKVAQRSKALSASAHVSQGRNQCAGRPMQQCLVLIQGLITHLLAARCKNA